MISPHTNQSVSTYPSDANEPMLSEPMNCTVELSVKHDGTAWGEYVCVVGDHPSLGSWRTPVRMSASPFPLWRVTLQLPFRSIVSYKYVICTTSGTMRTWEPIADNRTLVTPSPGLRLVVSDKRYGLAARTITRKPVEEKPKAPEKRRPALNDLTVEKSEPKPVEVENALKTAKVETCETSEMKRKPVENEDTGSSVVYFVSCVSTQSNIEEREPKSPPTEAIENERLKREPQADAEMLSEEYSEITDVTTTDAEMNSVERLEKPDLMQTDAESQHEELLEKGETAPNEPSPTSVMQNIEFAPRIERATPSTTNEPSSASVMQNEEMVRRKECTIPSTPKNCVRRLPFTTAQEDEEEESVQTALEEIAELASSACTRLRAALGYTPSCVRKETEEEVSLDESMEQAVENAREVRALLQKLREAESKRRKEADIHGVTDTTEVSPLAAVRARLSELRLL